MKRMVLWIFVIAAVVAVAVGMVWSWRTFDYRAMGAVFMAAMAGIAMDAALERLEDDGK